MRIRKTVRDHLAAPGVALHEDPPPSIPAQCSGIGAHLARGRGEYQGSTARRLYRLQNARNGPWAPCIGVGRERASRNDQHRLLSTKNGER